MQLFKKMCASSHCRGEERSVFGGWFFDFLEDNWQTNGSLPVIDALQSITIVFLKQLIRPIDTSLFLSD